LQRQKYRYCIHKDEFVIGIGRPWVPGSIKKRSNNAYPRVVGNLGMLSMDSAEGKVPLQLINYLYCFTRTLGEKKKIVDWFCSDRYANQPLDDSEGNNIPNPQRFVTREDKPKHNRWAKMLTDQITVGYANTLGWAHSNTGDTMVTVMIGGLRTVMNGDFEVFTGDLIQWYWPFEKDCFQRNGERKKYPALWTDENTPPNIDPRYDIHSTSTTSFDMDRPSQQREQQFQKSYGMPAGTPNKLVPRIKPFVRDDDNPRLFDAYRVFAVALSPARPHEPVDIKISRQSI
jgi:hypothetical protein